MYNEEIKMQYLNASSARYNKIIDVVSSYFNLCESMENALDKDISKFTLMEIIDFYKSLYTPSERYIASINSQLSMYTWWCQAQGMLDDNQNHFEQINQDIILACINKSVFRSQFITEGELENILGDPRIQNISDAFLIAALFEGICGIEYVEILNLYPKDIADNKVTLYTGRVLEVSKRFIRLARESAEEYRFFVGDLGDKEKTFDIDDRRCFKRYRKTALPEREKFIVIKRLQKLQSVLNCNAMNSKALMESGRVAMIHRFMKEDDCDFEVAIHNHRKEIEYRYGAFQSVASYIKKYKELLNP